MQRWFGGSATLPRVSSGSLAVLQQFVSLWARSVIFYWVYHDTCFPAVFTVVNWSGRLKLVVCTCGGSLSMVRRVWVTPYFSGHSWWGLVVGGGFVLFGEPQGTARVMHAPPQ
jgi:hypothetical protein